LTDLPEYTSKEILQQKLETALSEGAKGFYIGWVFSFILSRNCFSPYSEIQRKFKEEVFQKYLKWKPDCKDLENQKLQNQTIGKQKKLFLIN